MSGIRRRPWAVWVVIGVLTALGAWLVIGSLFGTTANSPIAGGGQIIAAIIGALALLAAAALTWRVIARTRR